MVEALRSRVWLKGDKMPEIASSDIKIKRHVTQSRKRIDWPSVFDGRVFTFKKGVDYNSEDVAFKTRALKAAKELNIELGFGEDEPEGQVTIQALL